MILYCSQTEHLSRPTIPLNTTKLNERCPAITFHSNFHIHRITLISFRFICETINRKRAIHTPNWMPWHIVLHKHFHEIIIISIERLFCGSHRNVTTQAIPVAALPVKLQKRMRICISHSSWQCGIFVHLYKWFRKSLFRFFFSRRSFRFTLIIFIAANR